MFNKDLEVIHVLPFMGDVDVGDVDEIYES
jgi:hypothetical protein